MQTVTKNCKNCKTSFTITYYLTVADEATDICNRCWNKRVSSYWTSTRDVLKNNHKSSHSYTDSLTSYSYSSKKTNFKPKSGIALYLDNLIPESKLKKKDKKKKKKKEVSSIVTTPNIPWLTNHSNGSKEPLMNSGLDHNVNSLLNKLKGA
jgi:hypothetical protein